mmetsp:Transcript_32037/g.77996  ORF Transcript_32037/g.77996 Transcript_32037/m.77996 type:complete len:229 (+) Transcript_32037:2432-3118(+)
MVDFVEVDHKEWCFRKVHKTIECREDLDHFLGRVSSEAKVTVRDIKLELVIVLFCRHIDLFAKVPEGLVEALSKLTFTLFVVHLVGIVHISAAIVDGLTCFHDLCEELDVHVLLLPDHDRIFQVEMDQYHNLVLARLKDSVLDIVVHNVNDLASGRNETHTVCMSLEISLCLPTGKDWTHGEVGQPWNTFVSCPDKLFLLDEICFFHFLDFFRTSSLPQLRYLTERLD